MIIDYDKRVLGALSLPFPLDFLLCEDDTALRRCTADP